MKKYLFIIALSLGLFWGSQTKAAESPIASTKATEALVDAFSFQTDGTIEVSVDKLTVDNIVIDGDNITNSAGNVINIGKDDEGIGIGTDGDIQIIWDTTAGDDIGRIRLPESTASIIPGIVIHDPSWTPDTTFDNFTDPFLAIMEDAGVKYGRIYHDGTDFILNSSSGGIRTSNNFFADNGVFLLDAKAFTFGTGQDCGLSWNQNQVVDTLQQSVGDTSNYIITMQHADQAFDFGHGNQTNPTYFIHSANQATDEWISMTHDQTDGLLDVGTGTLNLKPELVSLATYSKDVGATTRDLLVDNAGLIGYQASSIRYKENIIDMVSSNRIYDLRPVKFNYKKDKRRSIQYGLIAEEVAKIMPEIVSYNKEGEPETVNYSRLIPFILNEMKNRTKEFTRKQIPLYLRHKEVL